MKAESAHSPCLAPARRSAPTSFNRCFHFAIVEPLVRSDDRALAATQSPTIQLQGNQSLQPAHTQYCRYYYCGCQLKPGRNCRRRRCRRAPIRLFFLSVGGELVEESDDVVDFLIGFEAREIHLGVRDFRFRPLDVLPERSFVPNDAGILVGRRIAEAFDRSSRPAEKPIQLRSDGVLRGHSDLVAADAVERENLLTCAGIAGSRGRRC